MKITTTPILYALTCVLLQMGVMSGYAQSSELRCEYLDNPLGMDVREPRLSWVVPNTVRGDLQTAYRVKVSSTPAGEGDLWDSGKVASGESIHVKYQGKPLASGQRCYWTVETFGRDGSSHGVSEEASWTMGLLEKEDWKGSWIGAKGSNAKDHIWYRKKFTLQGQADSVFAYVASLGFHELYINGKKVDDRLMAPTLTALHKRVHYVTYDITHLLKEGENVIGIWYGPGWTTFNQFQRVPKGILAQVNIEFGEDDIQLYTDTTWRWKKSSSEHVGEWKQANMGGERVFASQLEPDWNVPGYNDQNWQTADILSYDGQLTAEMIAPDRVIEEIPVVKTEKVGSAYQISLEKNFTGFINVALKGPANGEAVIKIKDDVNKEEGEYGEFGQISYLVFDDSGEGVFQNRFNFMAGCELEISGVTEVPVLKAYAISTDLKRTGSFESSNDLLNRIYETDLWTFRATTINGVTVDCPHRERLGYGEVAFATSWGIGLPNYKTGAYYKKMIQGWMDVQHPDGNNFFVAPTPKKTWGGPLWSSAPLTVTYEMYRAYADKDIIGHSYETMKRWLDFLDRNVVDGVLVAYDGGNRFLGEWAAPNNRRNNGNSPEAELFNNCVYVMILDMFVEMAEAVDKKADVALYGARRDTLRSNVHQKFFNPQQSNYIDNIQTHLAFPLLTGVTPADKQADVLEIFEKEILETRPYLDMGSSGLPILLKFLLESADRSDIVFTHLNKETHPSYGYFLSRGETAWPEFWNSTRPSKIHTCYTGIASYFQKGALGIQNAPGTIGMKHIQIKPGVVDGLDWARGSIQSVYGVIHTGWKQHEDGCFTLDVEVPGNTTAELYLPKPKGAGRNWAIKEQAGVCWKNGAFVDGVPGITAAKEEGGFVVLSVGSGEYGFETVNLR